MSLVFLHGLNTKANEGFLAASNTFSLGCDQKEVAEHSKAASTRAVTAVLCHKLFELFLQHVELRGCWFELQPVDECLLQNDSFFFHN